MKKYWKIAISILCIMMLFTDLQSVAFAATPKIASVANMNQLVYQKQSYSLPKKVTATMSNNETKKVSITWNPKETNSSKVGTFSYEGTVKGYSKKVKLTLKVLPSDEELLRAVSMKIGNCQENKPVTYKQFFRMLDAVIGRIKPDALKHWESLFEAAHNSDQTMRRDEGMLALYCAAEELGSDYDDTNVDWWRINEKLSSDVWNEFSWNYPMFSEWKQSVQWGSNTWDNKMVAAFFYSMGRCSRYSEKLVFDFDNIKVTMRVSDPFTYEEAMHAALRLQDSGSTPLTRSLTSEDDKILKNADIRRNSILNSTTSATITGTTYYVSNSGYDSNDGLSPETAWASIDKINSMNFNAGDGVLFKRGDVFRGALQPKSDDNITFSAYGTGNKPKILGSPENGADPGKWSLVSGTTNIWMFYKDIYDTGVIVLNNGSSWASRKTGIWDGQKYVEVLDNSRTIDPKDLENLHFLSLPDYSGYVTGKAGIQLNKKGKLYLRCDEGNPGEVYSSIEFASSPNPFDKWALVQVGNNCTVDNLCVMYGNQCGIVIVGSNSKVQNCEVAWVGGCMLCFDSGWIGTSNDARVYLAGDGITPCQGTGNSITNNYVHHINDNGITDEMGSGDDTYVENLTISGNLIENCSGGILICDWPKLFADDQTRILFKNVMIENNYILYSGYGWSHRETEYFSSSSGPSSTNNGNCSLLFGFPENTGENIVVKNNVLYLNKYSLVGCSQGTKQMTKKYPVIFTGNIYIQDMLGIVCEWISTGDDQRMQKYYYNMNVRNTLADILGDQTAVVSLQ